ncbi:hypothetical protein ZHAS_00018371 [Anopheles sinensis]|uniref:Phenoloxidase-activating factor 2 n=1 Tax=Anopheles sinensis TaxID=74873 RepID=A0A084WHM5_ANOSI|nr:hypothetical protein ZHAS_00018371 [Anopheles sinensis]
MFQQTVVLFALVASMGCMGEPQRSTCDGTCVPYYKCKDNTILEDGSNIINIRFGDDSEEDRECPSPFEICCEKPIVLLEPPPSVTTTTSPPVPGPKCGYRNTKGLGFLITGNKNGESEYGEFPWMLAVLREDRKANDSGNVYECGASLIASNVGLTAAHCLHNRQKDLLLIRAGEWDTQTRHELYPHQDRRVAEIITHEQFNKGSLANDVALLILTEPFVLAPNVQPICLPPKEYSFDLSKCFASGWGKNNFGKEDNYQVILKKVELPVVANEQCQKSLRETRLGKRFILHPSFMCAGGVAGQDMCRGDGGSPLVCPISGAPGYYYQAGIVAWGIGCGEEGIPGVYGNVQYFREWIDNALTCDGTCVPYYMCKDNLVIEDGTNIIDIRVGEDPEAGPECPHYLDVCCEKADLLLEPPPSSPTTTSPSVPVPDQPSPRCGYRNTEGLGFRIAGHRNGESEYGEFPWMLAILREDRKADNSVNVYECGASLITLNVVLTAAHYMFNKTKDQLLIRAGEWDTQTRNELYPHQDRRVAEIITHKQFNKGSLANDVALLILTEPFVLAPNVQPICLPPKGYSFDLSKCFASGWGKNIFGKEGKYQVILKKVELPVVANKQCQKLLRETRLGKRFILHPSFMCAGGVAGQDMCRGDGGSPLVCPISGAPGYYYQAGIVAWGIGCGEEGIPGVYVSMQYFREWIDNALINRGILTHEYVYTR